MTVVFVSNGTRTSSSAFRPGKALMAGREARVPRSATALFLAGALAACDTGDVDWPVYMGDEGRQHYSELDQINRDNVGQLQQAWVYNSGEPSGTMYTSPLVVDGVFYALSPKLVPFALNAATGEEIWRTDLELPGAAQRGLMWWEKGDDRRILFAAGRELIALNADDGQLVPTFGEGGRLDMRPKENDRGGHFGLTAPGVVFEDKIIVGFTTTEWADSFPGSIRAFSAIDGELVWKFSMIPAAGERGIGDLGRRFLGEGGRRQRLDCPDARRGTRHVVCPDRFGHARFRGCGAPRRQPVRQQHRRPRRPHGRVSLALPGDASRPVGPRQPGTADACAVGAGRQRHRRRDADHQVGPPVTSSTGRPASPCIQSTRSTRRWKARCRAK